MISTNRVERQKSPRILITGSAGLIGSRCRQVLEAQGFDVIGVDILPRRGFVDVCLDIRDAKAVERVIENVDGIVHLAAVSRVITGERDPFTCFETNVTATASIVQLALRSARRPWLIYASSREVYGQQACQPVTESARRDPLNAYAFAKMAAEDIVFAAAKAGLRSAVARFSSVYGDRNDHATRVVPAFIRAARSGMPLRVEGSSNKLDFVHVDDAVSGVLKIAGYLENSVHCNPFAVHFVTGIGTSLEALARTIIEMVGDGTITYMPARSYDVTSFSGCPGFARTLLEWEPTIDLRSGLTRYIDEMSDTYVGT